MNQRALVFRLDGGNRTLSARVVKFTSPEDLAKTLEPDLDRCPFVEAWQEGVCLLRLCAEQRPRPRVWKLMDDGSDYRNEAEKAERAAAQAATDAERAGFLHIANEWRKLLAQRLARSLQ